MPLVISPRLIRVSGKIGKRFGKRAGKAFLTVIPLVIVWILTGLWHGTGMNYLVWGVYWWFLITLSTLFKPEIEKLDHALHIDTNRQGWKNFQMVRTFFLFCVGRVITIPGDLKITAQILLRIFKKPKLWQLVDQTLYAQGLDWKEFMLMLFAVGVLWLVSLVQRSGSVRKKIAEWNLVCRCAFYACSVLIVLIFGIYGPESETSGFAYMQF